MPREELAGQHGWQNDRLRLEGIAKLDLMNKAICMKPEGQISRTVDGLTLRPVEIRIDDTAGSYEAI